MTMTLDQKIALVRKANIAIPYFHEPIPILAKDAEKGMLDVGEVLTELIELTHRNTILSLTKGSKHEENIEGA